MLGEFKIDYNQPEITCKTAKTRCARWVFCERVLTVSMLVFRRVYFASALGMHGGRLGYVQSLEFF